MAGNDLDAGKEKTSMQSRTAPIIFTIISALLALAAFLVTSLIKLPSSGPPSPSSAPSPSISTAPSSISASTSPPASTGPPGTLFEQLEINVANGQEINVDTKPISFGPTSGNLSGVIVVNVTGGVVQIFSALAKPSVQFSNVVSPGNLPNFSACRTELASVSLTLALVNPGEVTCLKTPTGKIGAIEVSSDNNLTGGNVATLGIFIWNS